MSNITYKLPIALDAMGGDNAPASVVDGAALAQQRYPKLRFIMFGNSVEIDPLLTMHPALKSVTEVVHTDTVISSADKPSVALRQGKNSSMRLAIDAAKEGRAFGVVSAGNTGALMAMSKIVFKTLPGIFRPAIATLLPTMRGESVMLDLGANVECSSDELFQFAIMGDAYARAVLGLKKPKIGLLNVGSEEAKGHEEVRAASALLRKSAFADNFYGFVEGDDISAGTVDVVVTDGFTGNIALKTAEGTAKLISHSLTNALRSSFLAYFGYPFVRFALNAVKERLDPRKHNGAMFLGLNGITVKSHGSADAFSFSNAIAVAVELAAHRINERIIEEIKESAVEAEPAVAEAK